jgi:hypothetical protein
MVEQAKRVNVGMVFELVDQVGNQHCANLWRLQASITLPRSIPQGIEAGWRKPAAARGSVHESPVRPMGRMRPTVSLVST